MLTTYLKLAAVGAALLALAYVASAIHKAGYNAATATVATQEKERTNAANRADDAARRCAVDPDCRLRDDGLRRD